MLGLESYCSLFVFLFDPQGSFAAGYVPPGIPNGPQASSLGTVTSDGISNSFCFSGTALYQHQQTAAATPEFHFSSNVIA